MGILSYKTEGKDMKYTSFLVMMAAVLVVLLAAGCTSAPVKETSTTNVSVTSAPVTEASTSSVSVTETQAKDRYVQINLLDGTSVGGKYVSETAAFTTIVVMYVLDPNAYTEINATWSKDPEKYIVRGNGNTIAFKNSLINTMVDIKDPELVIEVAQQELRDEKIARDQKAEGYRIAKEAREAKKAP
jgi:outer membrane murein-binding lipoprotein Lpp